jgi:hypothetical protein
VWFVGDMGVCFGLKVCLLYKEVRIENRAIALSTLMKGTGLENVPGLHDREVDIDGVGLSRPSMVSSFMLCPRFNNNCCHIVALVLHVMHQGSTLSTTGETSSNITKPCL